MTAPRDEAIRALTAPGEPFELEDVTVRGRQLRVFKHAPATMRDVFESTAAHGDRTCLVYRDERITFAEHHGLVGALAHHLRAEGIGKGDRVGIAMRNYPEWVTSFWATLCLGAIAVPLNAWWLGSELEYAIEDSGLKALLMDNERWNRIGERAVELVDGPLIVSRQRDLDALPAGVRSWEQLRDELEPMGLPDVDLEADDHATILYTSGTTGQPKGALGTHRNHVTNIMNTSFLGAVAAHVAGTTPPEDPPQPASLQVFPFFHIGGLTGLYTATAFGSKLVTMYKWDLDEAIDILATERITSTGMVPTLLRELLDSPRLDELPAEALAAISSGGASVPPDLIRRIETRFESRVSPANGYGLTETTSAVVINTGADYFAHPDSVGRPALGAEVRIVDEDGNDLPDGTVGELWVNGPNIVDGYWNKPEATAESFTDGWFHTGDLAFRDPDGYYHVVDRLKDVVIRGGENVYSNEVEATLLEHPAVADVAVIGLPDEHYGEEVAAVVNLRPGAEASALDLQEFTAARLARFKVPTTVLFRVEPLPRTATGKVLKRDLRDEISSAGVDA
ncbi:MAG: class I adenylate-forming enzyme family protein [Actinomycetota bacterium]|nr:class I adenylate-forming enzyme family protein [Actinomycetota bacterium]